MTLVPLPDTVDDFNGLEWDTIASYYEELQGRLLTPDAAGKWLRDWSHLEALLSDTSTRLHVAYDLNTANEEKQAAAEKFITEIDPRRQIAQQSLKKKLVGSGYDAPEQAIMLRSFRNEMALFREENVPLMAEVAKLVMRYKKTRGAMTVEFDGQERTIPQMSLYLLMPDRRVREAAWRAVREREMADREPLHDRFDQMIRLRHQIALNAGFANYRDYMFREMGRFDYTPEDCKAFHAAIEKVIVPAVQRRVERRRQQMGLDALRPWDYDWWRAVDPLGRGPLRPFEQVDALISKVGHIFGQIDPTLAGYYDLMAAEKLLELESRKGKAPGGYSSSLYMQKRALIFMNAVGLHEDVQTLLHEAGHAFHTFERSHLPLIWDQQIPSEIAEVASMAMELLAAPYLSEFYDDDQVARARIEHLDSALAFLPYMAVVDAFQHWLYENLEHTHRDRDAQWAALYARFMPDVDWSGLEEERAASWQRQLHIYEVPFYYVEYGIAQVGAWQVWRNSLRDPAKALHDYRSALALGYTRPLPELYEAAGARLALGDEALLGELVGLIEDQLADLEGEA